MKRWQKIVLAVAAAALAVGLWKGGQALAARRALAEERAALYQLLQSIRAEDITDECAAQNWDIGGKIWFDTARRETFLQVLHAVPEEALVKNSGFHTGGITLHFRTRDGREYLLRCREGTVSLTGNAEMPFVGWRINDAQLVAYLEGLFDY